MQLVLEYVVQAEKDRLPKSGYDSIHLHVKAYTAADALVQVAIERGRPPYFLINKIGPVSLLTDEACAECRAFLAAAQETSTTNTNI